MSIADGLRKATDPANKAQPAPVVESVAAAPAAVAEQVAQSQAAAPTDPTTPEASAAQVAAPASDKLPMMSVARYNQSQRESKRAIDALRAENEQKLSKVTGELDALKLQLAQTAVAASPQTQGPEVGQSEEDWLDALVNEGVELHPEIAKHLRSLTKTVEDLQKRVEPTEQYFNQASYREAVTTYDGGMKVLLEQCPGLSERIAAEMIAEYPDGTKNIFEKVAVRYADFRSSLEGAGWAKATASAAAPSAPQNTPVPRLDQSGVAGPAASPQSFGGVGKYFAHLREQNKQLH